MKLFKNFFTIIGISILAGCTFERTYTIGRFPYAEIYSPLKTSPIFYNIEKRYFFEECFTNLGQRTGLDIVKYIFEEAKKRYPEIDEWEDVEIKSDLYIYFNSCVKFSGYAVKK